MYEFPRRLHCSFPYNAKKQYPSIGADNGWVSTRRQAIIWINDDLFTDAYMRHSAFMS